MTLSKKRKTKALIRLCGSTGWSAPLLIATPEDRVSRVEAHIWTHNPDHSLKCFKMFVLRTEHRINGNSWFNAKYVVLCDAYKRGWRGGGGGGLRPLVCTPYTPQHTQSIYLYFVLFLYGYETQYVNILYPFLLSLGPVVNILAIFSNANILKKIRE